MMAPERLTRIASVLEGDVRAGTIPGAVVLLVRDGEIVYDVACGFRERANRAAMTGDVIFRIASMTKPVVSVAAMTLVEEGRLKLGDSVHHYLPALADLRVGVARDAPSRAISVLDLLRHTSGFTYGHTGTTPIHEAYRAKAIGHPADDAVAFLEKLASIPLLHDPGTTWEYGVSTDVLGCVVEAVAGKRLGDVLAERIFDPLGMADTAFALDDTRRTRLAQADRDAHGRDPLAWLYDEHAIERRFDSGGAGLLSTAHDYARFAAIFAGVATPSASPVLGRKTLESMMANHLPPNCAFGPTANAFGVNSPIPECGQGFGLGLSVRTHAGRNPSLGSIGDVCWSGISGTYFWADPAERLVAVFLSAAPEPRLRYRELMRNLVYAALR